MALDNVITTTNATETMPRNQDRVAVEGAIPVDDLVSSDSTTVEHDHEAEGMLIQVADTHQDNDAVIDEAMAAEQEEEKGKEEDALAAQATKATATSTSNDEYEYGGNEEDYDLEANDQVAEEIMHHEMEMEATMEEEGGGGEKEGEEVGKKAAIATPTPSSSSSAAQAKTSGTIKTFRDTGVAGVMGDDTVEPKQEAKEEVKEVEGDDAGGGGGRAGRVKRKKETGDAGVFAWGNKNRPSLDKKDTTTGIVTRLMDKKSPSPSLVDDEKDDASLASQSTIVTKPLSSLASSLPLHPTTLSSTTSTTRTRASTPTPTLSTASTSISLEREFQDSRIAWHESVTTMNIFTLGIIVSSLVGGGWWAARRKRGGSGGGGGGGVVGVGGGMKKEKDKGGDVEEGWGDFDHDVWGREDDGVRRSGGGAVGTPSRAIKLMAAKTTTTTTTLATAGGGGSGKGRTPRPTSPPQSLPPPPPPPPLPSSFPASSRPTSPLSSRIVLTKSTGPSHSPDGWGNDWESSPPQVVAPPLPLLGQPFPPIPLLSLQKDKGWNEKEDKDDGWGLEGGGDGWAPPPPPPPPLTPASAKKKDAKKD